MKILYYSPHPHLNLASPAGYGTHMREMIAAFRRLGHEVYPVIIGGVEINDDEKDNAKQAGLKSIIKKITPKIVWETAKDFGLIKQDRKAKLSLIHAVNDFKPDLIYERANYLQTSGVEVAKEFNTYHILEVNSPYIEERKKLQGDTLYKGAKNREKAQLKLTDKIVVVSSALKEYFIREQKIDATKFIVTPNAINLVEIEANKSKDVDEVKDKELVIGFVGSFFSWHGIDLLINAFAKVQSDFDNLKLLIVGDGDLREELMSLAASLGVDGDVIFTGSVPHRRVYNYIEKMDICVMAKSNWYGSPVKIFEYGALGKAIIAPDNIPVKDVMVDKVDGLLIAPKVAQLTEALRSLIMDEKLRTRLGSNFKKKVINHHTWDCMAEMILAEMK